jgi:hypothetical protein
MTYAAHLSAARESFSRGKGSSGTGLPRNSQSGPHPSEICITKSLSFGTIFMIHSSWTRTQSEYGVNELV